MLKENIIAKKENWECVVFPAFCGAPVMSDRKFLVPIDGSRPKTLRHDEVKIVLSTNHGQIKQASLILDIGHCAGGQIGVLNLSL
jgi:hypothetical protein